MPEAPRPPIFRTSAIERVSSLDHLDHLIEIVGPRDWLPLAVLGALLLLAVGWAIAGRVPTTVSGRGILTHPRHIVDVQSLAAGRLEMLAVAAGDELRAGAVIARLDQFELRQQLEEHRTLLAELLAQDRAKARLQASQMTQQREQTMVENTAATAQTASLRQSLAQAEALAPLLAQRLEGLRALQRQGLVAAIAPELVKAEQDAVENAARISDLRTRVSQLDYVRTHAEGIETTLTRANLESDTARRTEIQQLRSKIAVEELQLARNGEVTAGADGRVVELFAQRGQIVAAGTPLATIDISNPAAELMNIAYFPAGDGKKIQAGMRVQVTPDTIERTRFGSITGVVTSVSPLPVTTAGSTALIGNAEVVRALMAGGASIEVQARLDADPATPTGYHWSSSTGPATLISAGLTSTMRVVVESRAPITYLLPFLRESTGVY